MIWLLKNWILIPAALLGLFVGWGVTAPFERHAGRAALLQEQAVQAASIERERVRNDAVLRNLSDRALCERALAARGMQHDCASLM